MLTIIPTNDSACSNPIFKFGFSLSWHSGLWGVFFFREIKGREIITKWFLSAAVAVIGIIGLSYEHEGGAGMGHRRYLSCAVDSIRQRFTMVPGTYTSNKMS